MNTDDLSEEAYDAAIRTPEQLDHSLTIWFGSVAAGSKDEDDYLWQCQMMIALWKEDPDAHMKDVFFGERGPGKKAFLAKLAEMKKRIAHVQVIPIGKRTGRDQAPVGITPATRTPDEALVARMNALVPYAVLPTREVVQALRSGGFPATLKRSLLVTRVRAAPDELGIACDLDLENGTAACVSITGLILGPDFPLFAEVGEYQRRRIKRLARQNR